MLGRPRRGIRPEGRLAGFAAWTVAHRRRVLGATGALAVLLGLLSLDLQDRLSNGGFVAGGTEAARADALLSRRFSAKPPDLVLLATAPGTVDSPRAASAGRGLTRAVAAHPGVAGVRSYWTERSADLRGDDHRSALLLVDLSGDDDRAARTAERLVPRIRDRFTPLSVSVTGPIWSNVQTIRECREDLHRSEVVLVPLAAAILMVAFRSAFAALCPVLVGGVVILASMAVLWLLTHVTQVSVFAPNLTTALGFGLAIDYSLFLISRHREELARGIPAGYAVQRTVSTAGRTVLFSALTVALATSSLLVFPIAGLRSLAWAAITVVLLAAAVTLLTVPPLLVLAGRRLHWDPLARLRRRPVPPEAAAAAPAPPPRGALQGAAIVTLLATASLASLAGSRHRRPTGRALGDRTAWKARPRGLAGMSGGLLTGGLLAGLLLAAPAVGGAPPPPADRRRTEPLPTGGLPVESPFWRHVARAATRAPVALGGGCAIVLLLLALPFLDARFGTADERMLPATAESHATAERVHREFAHPVDRETKIVLVRQDPAVPAVRAAIDRYARDLAAVPGVTLVRTVTGTYPGIGSGTPVPPSPERDAAREHAERARFTAGGATLVTVSGRHAAQSQGAGDVLERVRAVKAPGDRLITGRTAHAADTLAAIGDALAPAAGVVAATTLVLLFLFTGGLLVSVKALVLGALSLTASCGAIVAVFQNGHLRFLVGDFTVTGHLEAITLLLAMTVAFGLSVDYEVFLLSRIKEHHRATGDHTAAIIAGISRTGRLVTVAALAVAVSVGFLATSAHTVLKVTGFGIALAVLVDATLVRGLLVPAFMRLTGPANWWAPAPLARLQRRAGLTEPDLSYPSPARRGLLAAAVRRRPRTWARSRAGPR